MRHPKKLAEIERIAATDEWDDTSARVRAGYVQILRTIIASRLAKASTKDRARAVLRDRDIPLRAPVAGMGPSDPDAAVRNAKAARWRGMVRRQRDLLLAEMRKRDFVILDDAPPSAQEAAEGLVKLGEAVMVSDEMIRFTRGNLKEGQQKRRIRRVMKIRLPDDEAI